MTRIQKTIDSEVFHIVKGNGAVPTDAAATGMMWSKRIGTISGLEEAMKICRTVEEELSGASKKKSKEA